MARMTLEDLLKRKYSTMGMGPDGFNSGTLSQSYDSLANAIGYQGERFLPARYAMAGVGESGDYANEVDGLALTPEFRQALGQYSFDEQERGDGRANIGVMDAAGNPVGSYVHGDKDSALDKFLEKAIPLGLGALAGGSALGFFGGGGAAAAGGAGTAIGNGAFLGEAAASGLGGGAGLGGAGTVGAGMTAGSGLGGAGTIAGGSGMVAPTLGGTAGLGAGLGTAGGSAGAAAGAGGGSFWGGLAKAAIGPAISSGVQMFAANKAAGAQRDATNSANALQKYVYDTNRADNMPGLQARNSALEQMQGLLKDPSSVAQQPGYQFGLNEGTKTLNNGAAARGMTYSGAQSKALQRFGQDYAGTKLDQSFGRLSSLANAGQPGASAVGNATSNYGNNVGNNLMNMGAIDATKYLIGGSALGNGINGLTAYGQKQNWWGG